MVNSEPESAPVAEPKNTFGNSLWWFVMVQAGLLATLLPTALVFVLVEPGPLVPVAYALFALPVGPAIQAGMYALRRPEASLRQHPWSRYWEGWNLGWRQSLVMWVPVVALLTLVAAASQNVPSDAVWRPLVLMGFILAGVLTLVSMGALTIIASFSFRTRDVARVALFGLASKPMGIVGVVVIVFVAAALVALGMAAVVMLFMVLLCKGLIVTTRPMHRVVRDKLVTDPQQP